jgi:hypothetical protein
MEIFDKSGQPGSSTAAFTVAALFDWLRAPLVLVAFQTLAVPPLMKCSTSNIKPTTRAT